MDNMEFESFVAPEEIAEAAAPAPEQEAKGFAKFLAGLKKIPMKLWIIIGAALAVIIAAIVIIGAVTNNVETPIKLAVKRMNTQKVSDIVDYEAGIDQLNGFATSEYKAILKILKKSDLFKDEALDEAKEAFDENVENMKDEYGSNYKYSYKIENKEKLDNDDLKEIKDGYKDALKSMKDTIDQMKDMENDELEAAGELLGLSKTEMKNLISAYEKLYKKLKAAKITEAYEIEGVYLLKGSELDEPEETEFEMTVVKINGRWVNVNALSSLFSAGL